METKPKLILLPAVWAAETEIITFELNVLFLFAPCLSHVWEDSTTLAQSGFCVEPSLAFASGTTSKHQRIT